MIAADSKFATRVAVNQFTASLQRVLSRLLPQLRSLTSAIGAKGAHLAADQLLGSRI